MNFRIRRGTSYLHPGLVCLLAGILLHCEAPAGVSVSDLGDNDEEHALARHLTYSNAWQPNPRSLDPLALHRPASHFCPIGSWEEELAGLELDTGECNYFSLSQSIVENVFAGDRLELLLWWQPLISPEPARGHIAILVENQILWEEYVPIPSAANVRELDFVALQDIPAGTPITLHLHNHGANTWHFHHLLVHPQSRHSI